MKGSLSRAAIPQGRGVSTRPGIGSPMHAQPLDRKDEPKRGASFELVDGKLVPLRTADVRPPFDASTHYGTWRDEGKPEQQQNQQQQGSQSQRPQQDITELGDKLRAHA